MASPFSANPGPDVVVIARLPQKLAPIAEHIPAISSSAWKVLTPKFLCFASSCKMSDAGVIGYDPRNNSFFAFSAAARKPHDIA